jgi:aminoglycoside N3'-acetyltransferase
MKLATQDSLKKILKQLDIKAGDGLLVHSALQFLGQPSGGISIFWNVLKEAIGANGTIAVPTFNFGFAKGEPYDPLTTPSKDMGAFSEFVRTLPESKRTQHPMQSLAVLGKYAEDLAQRDTPGAFDDGSAFERMLELDFKLVLLGASVQAASIIHYSEQRANVPYRYWKDFKGKVLIDGSWVEKTYRMFVRDLETDPQLVLSPVQDQLVLEGKWHSQKLNYGNISTCKLMDFVHAADYLLQMDSMVFVKNKKTPQLTIQRNMP